MPGGRRFRCQRGLAAPRPVGVSQVERCPEALGGAVPSGTWPLGARLPEGPGVGCRRCQVSKLSAVLGVGCVGADRPSLRQPMPLGARGVVCPRFPLPPGSAVHAVGCPRGLAAVGVGRPCVGRPVWQPAASGARGAGCPRGPLPPDADVHAFGCPRRWLCRCQQPAAEAAPPGGGPAVGDPGVGRPRHWPPLASAPDYSAARRIGRPRVTRTRSRPSVRLTGSTVVPPGPGRWPTP